MQEAASAGLCRDGGFRYYRTPSEFHGCAALRIYNSLTRTIEPLKPLADNKIGMYVCGMTVYDYCHLGHARVLVVFDMVARYLRSQGYDVTYVRNITDVDDKILRGAASSGKGLDEFTQFFIEAMHEDERALAVLPPDKEPRATEHMEQIVQMITALLDKGFAYQADNGDVYYRVRQFPNYGRLSGELLDDLRVGARVAADESKDDPLDFVLWKTAKSGEPHWDSPWGPGRPGWHIECSAMSTHALGNHFDIHAGGMDLQFPHHENEIAQTEAATGEPFANLWMHIGHLRIEQEKMSKSLGNFVTIRQLLKRDRNRARIGEVIRFMLLSSHYRSPMHYSDAALEKSKAGLTRLYLAMDRVSKLSDRPEAVVTDAVFSERFDAAMDEDFNTPEAMAVLFDLAREINKAINQGDIPRALGLAAQAQECATILGLLQTDPAIFLGISGADGEGSAGAGESSDGGIDALVLQRDNARAAGDWKAADRIRDQLHANGIILEDGAAGTSWRRR